MGLGFVHLSASSSWTSRLGVPFTSQMGKSGGKSKLRNDAQRIAAYLKQGALSLCSLSLFYFHSGAHELLPTVCIPFINGLFPTDCELSLLLYLLHLGQPGTQQVQGKCWLSECRFIS